MTVQKIEKEITARVEHLITKRDGLIIREVHPRKMRELREKYEKEINALCAARREIRKLYPENGGSTNAI